MGTSIDLANRVYTDTIDQADADHDRQEPDATPDGGYGWVVVAVCFIHTFWQNAWTGSWGIFQEALLDTTLKDSNSGTISFIGSLGIALSCGLVIFVIVLARKISARWTALIGIILYGVSNIASSWAVDAVGGLFIASGFTYGIGACLMYTMSNSLPIQWFNTKLGAANGIVKLGGGIGATVMAVVSGVLIDKLGVAWTFRIFGILSLVTGGPAAFFIKERVHARRSYDIDWTLFKDPAFCCLFASGVIGVFSAYAPPFFLPTVAKSLGLSHSVSAGVVACFNACMAIGRLTSGLACDRFGSINTFLFTMALNGITMFVIWAFASSLGILLLFSIINGLANGAFFVALPTAVGRLAGERRGAVSLTITGWTPGLLAGNPIAGVLIDALGADKGTSIALYRPAIFYVGGTVLVSVAFIVAARIKVEGRLAAKV